MMTAPTPTDVRPDPGEIFRALSLLLAPGQLTELRALDVSTPKLRRSHTLSGYFDDPDTLVRAAQTITPHARGVYITPNSVDPALLARAAWDELFGHPPVCPRCGGSDRQVHHPLCHTAEGVPLFRTFLTADWLSEIQDTLRRWGFDGAPALGRKD